MIKKLLFFALITLLFNTKAFSQTDNSKDYTFKAEYTESQNSITKDVIISWNFNEVANKENLKLEIEIQPLNACWNEINGTNRSKKINHFIKDFNLNYKGNIKLSHSKLNSKCFKWRAKINNNKNVSYTEWKFSSFL